MAINVPGTAQKLADDYTQLGAYIGLTTGNPGTSSPPANEPTGGGYARQQTNWTHSSAACTPAHKSPSRCLRERTRT